MFHFMGFAGWCCTVAGPDGCRLGGGGGVLFFHVWAVRVPGVLICDL